jgi:WD40 repeat protein
VGNKEGKLVLWDLTNDVAVVTFEGSKGCIHCCAITSLVTDPDTQNDLEHLCIASGGADRCVRLWNLFNPTDKKRKLRHSRSVGCIAVAGKGFRPVLASGASDNNIVIWDITSGLQLQVLEGHKGPVNQLCVWEGFEILVISASADRTVRIFDALTGECVCTLVGHQDDVLDLAITSDQSNSSTKPPAIASCSLDNTIKFWDLDQVCSDRLCPCAGSLVNAWVTYCYYYDR